MENWDNTFETFDEFERRMRLEGYYGDFSSEARRKLIAKNTPAVSNVYDVLYVQTRESLLAKNSPIIEDSLEKSSELIRIDALRKNVEKNMNFDAINEEARIQNLHKNSLIKTASDLEKIGDDKRNELLSKNIQSKTTIDSYSSQKDTMLAYNASVLSNINDFSDAEKNVELSKNVPISVNIDTYADNKRIEDGLAYRNYTTNIPSKTNIDTYAETERIEELSKNVLNSPGIDDYAVAEKNDELSANVAATTTIDTYANSELVDELSANVPIKLNIDTYANTELVDELSANVTIGVNIDTYANSEKTDELSANVAATTNIDTYANSELVDELSANEPIGVNIDTYAGAELIDELSANVAIGINIDTYASAELVDELSANVPIGVNIDTYASAELIDELSANVPIGVNIDTYASAELADELAANVAATTNIDTYASAELIDELSANVPIGINIDTYASAELIDELSANIAIGINIDTYASAELIDELSANVPIGVNIDTYAADELVDELSANVPIGVNIDTYAADELVDELSTNVPIGVNIDTYASAELADELAANVAIVINIDTYASAELIDELSANIAIGINIDTYASAELIDELSANVPTGLNIDIYAIPEMLDELAANVPIAINIDTYASAELIDELSANVPIGLNIDTYAIPEMLDELSANVPTGLNIDTYAAAEKNDELAANVPTGLNIDLYASNERNEESAKNDPSPYNIDSFIDAYGNLSSPEYALNNLLSKNVGNTLGVNVAIGGTSLFLGISNLLIQGAILKNIMTIPNKYAINTREYRPPLGLKAIPNVWYDFKTLDSAKDFYRESKAVLNQVEKDGELKLLANYGINAPQESRFVFGETQIASSYGELTIAIRNYNLARNSYSIYGNQQSLEIVSAQKSLIDVLNKIYQNKGQNLPGHPQQGIEVINSYTNTEMLKGAMYKNLEQTNVSPDGNVMQTYLSPHEYGDAVDMLKPNSITINNANTPRYPIGTAGSMMTQIRTSDVVEITFLKGESETTRDQHSQNSKGVRKIIDVISKDENIPIAQNYKRSQNEFVVGTNTDATPKLSYQRYTYANPYNPEGTVNQQLNFSLTNYANGLTMYFPPYIKSYRHDANASWDEHSFLGRPDSIYTYSKSSRAGSISFIVLTDYAEAVQIGSIEDKTQDVVSGTYKNFSTPFSNDIVKVIEAKIIDEKNELKIDNDTLQKLQSNSNQTNSTEISLVESSIRLHMKNISDLEIQLKDYQTSSPAAGNPYHEFGGNSNYSKSINDSQKTPWGATETKTYLDNIIKNLLFVPSFFSGSKADFITKMDFLQKLVRPAKNNSASAFGFTKPPVCHVELGDWFDYDIIIDSVTCDYSDSIWTLDDNLGGRVQPMYATVDITFKIVGAYGGGGKPSLATDVGGFFTLPGKTF